MQRNQEAGEGEKNISHCTRRHRTEEKGEQRRGGPTTAAAGEKGGRSRTRGAASTCNDGPAGMDAAERGVK